MINPYKIIINQAILTQILIIILIIIIMTKKLNMYQNHQTINNKKLKYHN